MRKKLFNDFCVLTYFPYSILLSAMRHGFSFSRDCIKYTVVRFLTFFKAQVLVKLIKEVTKR